MYIRKIRVKGKTYLALVHSVRNKNKVRQIYIANLGNIERHKQDLLNIGTKILLECGARNIPIGDLLILKASEYGRILILQRLFEESGLESWLSDKIKSSRRPYLSLAHIKAMIFNRVCEPKSKYSILRWLEDVAFEGIEIPQEITDKQQKRFAEILYRNMDFLLPLKEQIEVFLYDRVKTLFDIEVDVVFYDLTSIYFEGDGPEALAAYGYSRDEKPNNVQIILGMVIIDGFPIAYEVFKGNKPDKSTVEKIVGELRKRFKIKRVIFVGDSGVLSEENIKYLERVGYEYILASRRRDKRWGEIFSGWEKKAFKMNKELLVYEINKDERRIILCHSEKKRLYEESMRKRVIEKIGLRLEELAKMVKEGRIKDLKKIISRAERILSKKRGRRYFKYSAKEGEFKWGLNEVRIEEERFIEGKTFLVTNNRGIKPEQIVNAYKELFKIEQAFREIKDFIKIRPIYHWTDRRVKAHVLICMLAYFLEKMLERKLQEAKLKITARKALESAKTVKLALVQIGDQLIQKVSCPGPIQQGIFRAININKG